jgi:hypothetical protein
MNIVMSKTSSVIKIVGDYSFKTLIIVLIFTPMIYFFCASISIKINEIGKSDFRKITSNQPEFKDSEIKISDVMTYSLKPVFAYIVDIMLIIQVVLLLFFYDNFQIICKYNGKNKLLIKDEAWIYIYCILISLIILIYLELYFNKLTYEYINLFGVNLNIWLIGSVVLFVILLFTHVLLWYFDRIIYCSVEKDPAKAIAIFGGFEIKPEILDCLILVLYWLFFNYIIVYGLNKHSMMNIFDYVVEFEYFIPLTGIVGFLMLSVCVVRFIYNKSDVFMLGFLLLLTSFLSSLKFLSDNNDAKIYEIDMVYIVIVALFMLLSFAIVCFAVFNWNPNGVVIAP